MTLDLAHAGELREEGDRLILTLPKPDNPEYGVRGEVIGGLLGALVAEAQRRGKALVRLRWWDQYEGWATIETKQEANHVPADG